MANALPDFGAEDARGGEHEFLRAGVPAIGGEGSNQGGQDSRLEADSGVIHHNQNYYGEVRDDIDFGKYVGRLGAAASQN